MFKRKYRIKIVKSNKESKYYPQYRYFFGWFMYFKIFNGTYEYFVYEKDALSFIFRDNERIINSKTTTEYKKVYTNRKEKINELL